MPRASTTARRRVVVATARTRREARDESRSRRILSYASTGVDPTIMGMGPVPAVRRRSSARGSRLGDIDLFELNEAFAAQSVAVVRELGLDRGEGERERRRDRAWPSDRRERRARADDADLRAAGARRRYGVASLCIGGGMGIAMVIEVPAA